MAVGLMLLSAAAAHAQKVGIINIQAAIANSSDGQQAAKDLQAKFLPKGQELQKAQQEIVSLQDQLRNQEKTLAEDARQRLLKQIDDKTRAFNRSNEDFQAETQSAEQEAINTIGQKMMQVLKEFREKNGYALILDSQTVVDADPASDVTMQVVEAYNAANAKPAAGATAAPAAPAAAAPATPPAPASTP
jgi:outer membrane protein